MDSLVSGLSVPVTVVELGLWSKPTALTGMAESTHVDTLSRAVIYHCQNITDDTKAR